MNFVSVLGLVALLAIAWAMSFRRRDVKWRPVVWGLALQFIFALAILRHDALSFVGMGMFGVLILAFILREGEREDEGTGISGAMAFRVAVASLLAGGAAVLEANASAMGFTTIVGPVWLVLVLVVFLSGRLSRLRGNLRWGGAAIVAVGLGYLIGSQTYGEEIFTAFSQKITGFLNLSDYGARFLFGMQHYDGDSGWPGFASAFAFKVLPTIIFFGGFMAIMYYLGVMQKVITAISRFMRWTVGTSGAETMSCSANIFVGQTEAPLLIRPFLQNMTNSELATVMVGGFATIAGGVLAAFIALGVPAAHLIAATVMSAPAALAIGKILYPETEHSETAGDVELPTIDAGENVVEAATSGISDGLKLAVNVGAMLIGFIAIINGLDLILSFADGWIDGRLLDGELREYSNAGMSAVKTEYTGIFPGSLRTLFGTILSPLAWLMGVPWEDADKVGNLLGIKLSLNEFVAISTFSEYLSANELSERSAVISTYALCGFANFASIGIQIGGLSALAPERRKDLAKLGLRAMFAGALASWTTATVAGILI